MQEVRRFWPTFRAEIPTKHVVILSLNFEGKFDAKGALTFRPKAELKKSQNDFGPKVKAHFADKFSLKI